MKIFLKKIYVLLMTLLRFGWASFSKRLKIYLKFKAPSLGDIQKIHLVSDDELENQKRIIFEKPIKFSIITPLYNTPRQFLSELIESVQNQTYANWEFCLADGSDSNHTDVGEICREYAKKDSRIIYKKLAANKGISGNTNECLSLATGDYYGLLDHDDLLHPSALFEVCKTINEQKADFIYSDEVKFSGNVQLISDIRAFNLKPGFGIDDLRAHNYICHFTVFSKELLKNEKELFRSGFDGSQDHDLVLRLTEKANKICHINKVLYYWRVHENSVSMNLDSKSYAVDAAIRAVREQLKRKHQKGTVMSSAPFRTLYKIEYEILSNPLISILVYGLQDSKVIKEIVEKLKASTNYDNYEIILMIDGDLNFSFEQDNKINVIKVIGSSAERFNQAIQIANGEQIVLLNGNVQSLSSNWLEELLMHSQREDISTVGAKIYNRDKSLLAGGISLSPDIIDYLYYLGSNNFYGEMGYEAILCHARNVTANDKVGVMFKKQLWEELNGFKDDMGAYFFIDFCLRSIQLGYRNIWTAYSEIFMTKNLKDNISSSEIETFKHTWYEEILNDNYINKYWRDFNLV